MAQQFQYEWQHLLLHLQNNIKSQHNLERQYVVVDVFYLRNILYTIGIKRRNNKNLQVRFDSNGEAPKQHSLQRKVSAHLCNDLSQVSIDLKVIVGIRYFHFEASHQSTCGTEVYL
jgi:hypothetical protein